MKKILIIAANPPATSRLRLEQEIRDVEEAIQRSRFREQFKLEIRVAARPIDIQRALLDIEPQIVHFCGHGEGQSGLVLEDIAGLPKFVSAQALSSLFKLFANSVECVLLNACYSEVQADAIVQHINYVIGMNQEIRDDAAIAFAVGFYDALGAGKSIEFAYELGCVAIQTAIHKNTIGNRKLIPVDVVGESRTIQEHLKPVLKRKRLTFDYTRLEDLLKTGRWKEADQETFTIMLTIADCEAKQYLDVEDIQKFPSEDLKTIDNLWRTHSNSHFGFSVQNEIWKSKEINGNPHSGVKTFRAFGDYVGWRMKYTVDGKEDYKWRDYNSVLFSLKAPKGHLPWGGWGDPGKFKRWRLGYLFACFDEV
ncbi:MAG: GUN4 domain-containing protein [Nostoc sp. DedQUE12a]|nr:GUN4 domain-containing protein [Nostoc sp. DedQUE12a]